VESGVPNEIHEQQLSELELLVASPPIAYSSHLLAWVVWILFFNGRFWESAFSCLYLAISLSKVHGGFGTNFPWFFFSLVFQVPISGLCGTNVRKT
jgi:hypothetical protein